MAKSTIFSKKQTTHPPDPALWQHLFDVIPGRWQWERTQKRSPDFINALWVVIYNYLTLKQRFLESQQWGMKAQDVLVLLWHALQLVFILFATGL